MFQFYTLRKQGFLVFLGVIKWEHWLEIKNPQWSHFLLNLPAYSLQLY